MLLSAVGCASTPERTPPTPAPATPTSDSPVVDRIRQSGELRVGMAGDYPPLNVQNREGRNIGMEPDLADALARAMGVRLVVVEKPFAELLPALAAGELDAALSGITITPERNLEVAFAGPYFISGKAVLTRTDRLPGGSSANELDRSNIRLAALRGTTSQTYVEKQIPQAQLIVVDSYAEGVQMVSDEEVYGLIADYPICVVAALRAGDLSTLPAPLTFEPVGVAMPPNDPLFVNIVQNYLRSLEDTGVLARLHAKWFEDASWVRELPDLE